MEEDIDYEESIKLPKASWRFLPGYDRKDMLDAFSTGSIKVGTKGFVIAVTNNKNACLLWQHIGGTAFELSRRGKIDPIVLDSGISYRYAIVDSYRTILSANFRPSPFMVYSDQSYEIFPYKEKKFGIIQFIRYDQKTQRRNNLWRQFNFTCSFAKWIKTEVLDVYQDNPEIFLDRIPYPEFVYSPRRSEIYNNLSSASDDSNYISSFINLAILNKLIRDIGDWQRDGIIIHKYHGDDNLYYSFKRSRFTMQNVSALENNEETIFPFDSSYDFFRTGKQIDVFDILFTIKDYMSGVYRLETLGDTDYDDMLSNIGLEMVEKAKLTNISHPDFGEEESNEDEDDTSEEYEAKLKYLD